MSIAMQGSHADRTASENDKGTGMKNRVISMGRAFVFLVVAAGLVVGGCADDSETAAADGQPTPTQTPTQTPPQNGVVAPTPPAENTPPSNAGDKYTGVGTNPFVLTLTDPLSTFAVDVDTASYDIFRRDVGFGLLPQPASVRVEEYINAFKYDYAAPSASDSVPFAIHLASAPSPYTPTAQILRVAIKGRELDDEDQRGANLVFLIDTSGSMQSAQKLPLVQQVLTEALELLQPDDTISIVTYAGGTGVALPPTPVSQKSEIAAKINSFQAGGSTAGAAGITLAYDQAKAGFKTGAINHVILCTDGDFNVGAASDTALVQLIEEKRKTGITLTVLGFGIGNLNDSMMEKISNAGNGTYSVISSTDHAITWVHDRLLSGMHFIAKDMKIQVAFNPNNVLAYRLIGYENRDIADEDFKNDAVDAGEVGAGHSVTALYEVIPIGGLIPQPEGLQLEEAEPFDGEIPLDGAELVNVQVRWKDSGASEEDPAYETNQGLDLNATMCAVEVADSDFRWATSLAAFAELLKGSPYANPVGMKHMVDTLEAATAGRPERQEAVALIKAAAELMGH